MVKNFLFKLNFKLKNRNIEGPDKEVLIRWSPGQITFRSDQSTNPIKVQPVGVIGVWRHKWKI